MHRGGVGAQHRLPGLRPAGRALDVQLLDAVGRGGGELVHDGAGVRAVVQQQHRDVGGRVRQQRLHAGAHVVGPALHEHADGAAAGVGLAAAVRQVATDGRTSYGGRGASVEPSGPSRTTQPASAICSRSRSLAA